RSARRREPRFRPLPGRARLGRDGRRRLPRRRLPAPDPRPPRHRRLLRRPVREKARDMHDRILILDFGSQVTQLIARRVRENGVYCEIHPFTVAPEKIREFAPRAVILSGGPASVTLATTPRAPRIVFELGVPILAICYGMQTMCAQLGGRITRSVNQEFGRAMVDIVDDHPLFAGIGGKGSRAPVWMSHGDRVDAIPPGFRAIASTDSAPFAAVADDARRFYGVLF